jgi:hypothetical protein
MGFTPEEWADAEDDVEALTGKPFPYRNAEEALRSLHARRHDLQARLAAVQSRLADPGRTGRDRELDEQARLRLTRDLTTTAARLAEYEAQHKGRN